MSCRPYINNLSKNPRVQNELDKLHNSIFNRLIDSKLFNKWEDYHFLPTNQAKYAAAKNLISQINEQYKKKVAGTSFTKASGKEFVFVNVKNFVKEFEEGQSLLEAQQVDEFGDSVPMYNRQPDISKLSDVEKTIYKSSPTEFISYLRDQLYGLSNGVKVYENPPSEKSMVERYGKELIALAKENPMYNRVDYKMKVINNILSNKEKVDKWLNNKSITPPSVFWEKLQKDLQIPRPQVDLLAASEGNTFDEKLANFMANYSYTIEINTARKGVDIYDMPSTPEDPYQSSFNINGRNYIADYQTKEFLYRDELVEFDQPIPEDVYITYDEFKQAEKDYVQSLKERNKGTNSDYHSNLTVPGGTNYTENEISTPLIVPSIKGHAQFSTDNGIGWFRSDDAAKYVENSKQKALQRAIDDPNYLPFDEDYLSNETTNIKTRRILEIQSDLFQKGRDKEDLTGIPTNKVTTANLFDNEEFSFELNGYEYEAFVENIYYEEENQTEPTTVYYKNGVRISNKEMQIAKEEYKKQNIPQSQNQFLQLLNKDNNWVTFFVKSIIQDTAKQTITEVQESDVEAKVRELEKEGLLEIDCKGLKAKDGLRSNFTKGGKWKIIKDLKGYPTHKEGGVDLTIGKEGVKIKNGNTEFIAKHGLVIPKN